MKPINSLSDNSHSRHFPAALLFLLIVPFIVLVCARIYSEVKHPSVEISSIIDLFTSELKENGCCPMTIYDSIPALIRLDGNMSKASFEGKLLAEGARISKAGSHETITAGIDLTGTDSGPDILDIYVYIDLSGRYIDLPDHIVKHYDLKLVADYGGYSYHQCIYSSSDGLYYGTVSSFGNKAGSYDIIVGMDYDRVSSYMEFGETAPTTYIP